MKATRSKAISFNNEEEVTEIEKDPTKMAGSSVSTSGGPLVDEVTRSHHH